MVIFLTDCNYSEATATQPVRKQNPFIHRHLLLVYVFSCVSRLQPDIELQIRETCAERDTKWGFCCVAMCMQITLGC